MRINHFWAQVETDPSSIIRLGEDLCAREVNFLRDLGSLAAGNIGQQMSIASMQLGIELSFIIIAIQIFVISLEFYIIGALAIVFLPFGANVHTRFLADKVWPAIVGCGVKLMVLAFIMSAAIPELFSRKLALAAELAANPHLDPNASTSIESLGMSMALAFLCWQAPSMAAGLMTGMGPGSSASTAQQTKDGMTGMSASMGGGAGMGARFSNALGGVSAAMVAATGKALTPPPINQKE